MKLGAMSRARGHKIAFDEDDWQWLYADTNEPLGDGNGRPCIRCGRLPTKEGHDACLGMLRGVVSACCGHGVVDPFIMYVEDRV
jgi:hypothetical protein